MDDIARKRRLEEIRKARQRAEQQPVASEPTSSPDDEAALVSTETLEKIQRAKEASTKVAQWVGTQSKGLAERGRDVARAKVDAWKAKRTEAKDGFPIRERVTAMVKTNARWIAGGVAVLVIGGVVAFVATRPSTPKPTTKPVPSVATTKTAPKVDAPKPTPKPVAPAVIEPAPVVAPVAKVEEPTPAPVVATKPVEPVAAPAPKKEVARPTKQEAAHPVKPTNKPSNTAPKKQDKDWQHKANDDIDAWMKNMD